MSLKKWVAGAALIAVAAVALTMLFRSGDSSPALAHEDPAGCSSNFQSGFPILSVFFDNNSNGILDGGDTAVGSAAVEPGDELLYAVGAGVPNLPQPPCDAFNVQIWLCPPAAGENGCAPGGTDYVHVCDVAVGAGNELEAGDAPVTCNSGAPGVVIDATYPNGVVPYTASAADLNASNRFFADMVARGDVHNDDPDCVLTESEKDANNTDPGQCFRALFSVSSNFAKVTPEAVTEVHDATHTDITNAIVVTGTVIHDYVNVNADDERPTPTGNVTFTLYSGLVCDGAVLDTDIIAIAAEGATGDPNDAFAETVPFAPAAGEYSFLAVYGGDDSFNGDTAPCEPFTVGTPEITVVKTAGSAADGALETIEAGDSVIYHYEVCNTGDLDLVNVTVDDDGGTLPDLPQIVIGSLAVGACVDVDSDPVLVPDTGTACGTPNINIATANGTSDPGDTPVSDTDPASVCVLTPAIRIIKTAGSAADGALETIEAGDSVIYHYEVCNIGEIALVNVDVNDDGGSLPNLPEIVIGALAVGACVDVDSDPVLVPDTGTACGTPNINIATAAGDSTPGGTAVSDTDNASVCVLTPGIRIIKTAGSAADGELETVEAGDSVIYHYEVCNIGEIALVNVTVDDDGGTLPALPQIVIGNLAVGACVDVDSDPVLVPDTGEACETPNVNIATANGTTTPGGTNVNDTDNASVCVASGDIRIIKTAGSAADGALETIEAGDSVIYHYEVCNVGEIDLINVTVDDDGGTLPNLPQIVIGNLAVGACVDVDSDPVLIPDTGTFCETPNVNIATANGTTDPGNSPVSDTDPASVCVLTPDIEIVKTAGSAADGDPETIEAGDTVIYHYEVCNTGEIDLVNVDVNDDGGSLPNLPEIVIGSLAAGACVNVDSDPVTVPDTGNECDTPNVNVATAAGTTTPGGTNVDDTDNASVCVVTPDISIIKTAGTAADGDVFELPNTNAVVYHYEVCNTGETDLTNVTVTDDNGPLADLTPIVIGNLAQGACTIVHSVEVIIPNAPECGTTGHINTATATGTTPAGGTVDDTDPAEVCAPPLGGEGCTPGFWKNHIELPRNDEAWPPTGYTINTTVEAAFMINVPGIDANFTLLQALNAGGGGLNALLRHATAALLNSAHPDVNSDLEGDVIGLFQDAINAGPSEYNTFKNIFAESNENGCPINGKDPRVN